MKRIKRLEIDLTRWDVYPVQLPGNRYSGELVYRFLCFTITFSE